MASTNIFISYAHPDDKPIPPAGLCWISNFHEALKVRLPQVLGSSPDLWRDNLLNGSAYFWETIEDELAKGGLLVSVLTPSYVNSESCLRELNNYFRFSQQHGGVKIRDQSRIFKVIKFPFEEKKLPPEMNQLLGYNFFRKNDKGEPRDLDPDLDPENKRLFRDKLDDLVYDIRKLLDLIRHGANVPPSQGVVYLAETPYDCELKRDQLRRDLTDRGYTVLPGCKIHWDNPEFRDVVRRELGRCQMSIHLIGASGGIVPEAEEQSITGVQAALAAEQVQARSFTRIIWIPDGIKPDKERHKRLIKSLETDRLPHSEILKGSLEELKAFVLERLEAKPPPVSAAISTRPRIYLVCEELDLDQVEPIRKFLFDQDYEVDFPPFQGGEEERGRLHREFLQLDQAVLIYDGSTDDAWRSQKILDLQKAPGYGRTSPFLAQAVYVAAPATDGKQRYQAHSPRVIKEFGAFSPSVLAPFLEDLQQNLGRR